MKQPDEQRNLHEQNGKKSQNKSFFRTLIPSKSSSSQLKNKESLDSQQKQHKDDKSPFGMQSGIFESKSKSNVEHIREQQSNLIDVERQDLQRDKDKLSVPQSSHHRSESRPRTKKLVPLSRQTEDISRPIHWVVPDYVNQNKSPRVMASLHPEKALRRKADPNKDAKTAEAETIIKQSSTLPQEDRPRSIKQAAQRDSNRNAPCKATNKNSPSTSAKINHPTKKRLSIESSTRRKNRKLVHLVTELRKNCDLYRKEIKRVKDEEFQNLLQLQQENENLNLELYNLNQEADGWKSKCKKQENQNVALVKVKNLTKKTSELTEDIEVLKSVIHRLNKEMRFYQDKLKVQNEHSPNHLPLYSTQSSSSSRNGTSETDRKNEDEILKEPNKKLFPLLIAYDEVIKEKNELIKSHEEALERFKKGCQEVVQENEDLHEIISDRKEKGMVSIQEWQFLHANSVIVLEENDLLHEQISVLKQKEDFIMKNHQDKVSKLKTRISQLEEDKLNLKSAATKTETNCKILMDQHAKLADIIEDRIPLEQHEASVLECKKLFEELKISYGDERSVLMDKLSAAEKESDRLALELAELEAENGRIQSNIKTCEDALAVNAIQFREVYNKLIVASEARDTTTSAMEEMMQLSQRVVSERESTEEILNHQRDLNQKLIHFRDRECELIAELHSKIKAMEDVHQDELKKLILRIKELEKIINGIGESHRQEMLHLEKLTHEKEKRIEHLETEKGQLQSDLETVWKTTTQCTIKELRSHK